MARKSGYVLRRGVMRRETSWASIVPTDTAVAAATAVTFLGFSAGLLALRPFTIVRTRGYIHMTTDQVAATENQSASMGLAVVSDQALAIGVTAVPTPETDRSSDLFFVHESLASRFIFSTAVAYIQGGIGRVFDSKAMRKVEEGQDVALSVETTGVSSGIIWHKSGRILVKLH